MRSSSPCNDRLAHDVSGWRAVRFFGRATEGPARRHCTVMASDGIVVRRLVRQLLEPGR